MNLPKYALRGNEVRFDSALVVMYILMTRAFCVLPAPAGLAWHESSRCNCGNPHPVGILFELILHYND